MIKVCERGDYQPAVGTGIRPVRVCRDHYLEDIADEIVRAEVIGDVPVTDVRTGASVGRGGVVELDPVETRIEQLVYAGHIKVIPHEGGVVPGDSEQTLAAGEYGSPAEQAAPTAGTVRAKRSGTRAEPDAERS